MVVKKVVNKNNQKLVQLEKGKGGKDYTDNLPPNDPAYTGKDKKDNDVDEKSKEKKVSQEKIGKVEDSGGTSTKMMF